MLDSVIILEKIILDPPTAKIYSRLGFKKRTTSLTSSQQKETDCYIEEAVSLISLQGSFLTLPVHKNDGRKVLLAGEISFASAKFAAFLGSCPEAALMGATAGRAIMEAIATKTKQDNFTAAVVYDATASEMADAALDWIMDYINRQLRRESRHLLPRRFSAGYADLALENQKEIYEILQLAKIGVTITPDFLLVPEKSVTAISGIM
ncbi:MAG: methionine synthase [Smithellaceae bacterium]